jgi:hypothetical protein
MRRAPTHENNDITGQHKAIFQIGLVVHGRRIVGYAPAKSRYGRQQGRYSRAIISFAAFSPASVMQ